MRSFSTWIIGLFASTSGVVVLGALDSTLFFSLPFGIDAVVIILAAQMADLAWVVPLLATAGSLAGAWLTFWMGIKIGEKGLDRYIAENRLERIRARIRRSGALALAVLDLIPPPFPFTPFVLAAGALEVKSTTFFATLAVCRLLRFGLEAALARRYGTQILRWLQSDLVRAVVAVFIVLAIVLSVVALVRIVRTSAPRRARRARA
ncbi:MAG TPA: VTT domain-containing protein [Vicinamibacterales bacterium]|nr:VTT domain-containing protein [Vicinamibacterales bacterium]